MIGITVLLLAAGCNNINDNRNSKTSTNNAKYINRSNGSMGVMNHGSPTTSTTPIQSHRTYSLNMLSSLDNIKPGQSVPVKFNIKDEQGNILKDLEIEHTKILHFIIVRQDLQQFQHIHPDFNQSTGEFSINVTFPTDGPYRMFADFTPQGAQMGSNGMALGVTINKDVAVGYLSNYKAVALTIDTNILKVVDGYRINYNFPKIITANSAVDYGLIIEKNNQKVRLGDYLGAKGHSIILKEGAVDYIHNHANGAMNGMGGAANDQMQMLGDSVDFSTSFPEAGTYKVFTQFQIKGKVVTTDYTVKIN